MTGWGVSGRDGVQGALATGVGDRFPTSYVSCCSWAVKIVKVVLILVLVLFYLSESYCRWLWK